MKSKEEVTALNEEFLKVTKKRLEAGDVPLIDAKLAEQALANSCADLLAFKTNY